MAREVEIQIDESQIGCDVLAGNALAFNRFVSTCFRAVAHAVETIRSPDMFLGPRHLTKRSIASGRIENIAAPPLGSTVTKTLRGISGALLSFSAAPRKKRRLSPLLQRWFALTQPPYGTSMPQSGRRPQRQKQTRAVQRRRAFLKVGYQACVDQHAIEAARFGPIGAAVK